MINLEPLTNCEEEIYYTVLKLTEKDKECVSMIEILEQVKDEKGWKRQTVSTFIIHIRDKGYLRTNKVGRVTYYYPLVSKDDYLMTKLSDFGKWFASKKAMLDFIKEHY